jgi:tetratricopeptide (TPR) repeat protein
MIHQYVPVCIVIAVLVGGAGCTRSPEARRDGHLAKGKALLEKKDYSRAILEFRNASQAMPNDAEPYYQFAVASLAVGDYQAGVLSLKKTLDLNAKHAGAQLRMAQLMASTRDPELLQDAEARLKELMKNTPGVETLSSLAFTQLKLGSIQDGVRNLEQILAKAPGDLTSVFLLAKAKLWQKDTKGAEQVLLKAASDAPNSAEAQILLAHFYASQNRFPEAEDRLSKALALAPANGPALMLLGRLQLAAGKKGDAEQTFRKVAPVEGYRSVYALFLYQEGRRDEAIRELERLSKEYPDDRIIRTQMIGMYRAVNRKQDAKRVLEAALAKNGKDGEALIQRAELLLEDGKVSDAEQDVNRVLKLLPTAPEAHYVLAKVHRARGASLSYRQELGEALRLNPALESIRSELAGDLIRSNSGQAALDVLNAAPPEQRGSHVLHVQRNWAWWALGNMAELRKGIDAGLAAGRVPDYLIQNGLWHLRAGNAGPAKAALEEALKIDPGDVRALQFLSQTYMSLKDARGAVQKVKEYADQNPKSAAVQHFFGTLLMANADKQGARKAFHNAKSVAPEFVNADLSLIQVDMTEGKVDDARKKLEAVLARDKENLTARMWLGNLQLIAGDARNSTENFRQVIAANPKNAEALNNLAWVLAENGAADDALKHAEKAVELQPKNADFNDTLGWIMYKKGVYSLAIKYLEKADTGNPVVKYHLAMAYAKVGDLKRGRVALDAALKINPNVAEAKLAQAAFTSAR